MYSTLLVLERINHRAADIFLNEYLHHFTLYTHCEVASAQMHNIRYLSIAVGFVGMYYSMV